MHPKDQVLLDTLYIFILANITRPLYVLTNVQYKLIADTDT